MEQKTKPRWAFEVKHKFREIVRGGTRGGGGGSLPPSACKRNSSTVGVSEEESVHPKGTYESQCGRGEGRECPTRNCSGAGSLWSDQTP